MKNPYEGLDESKFWRTAVANNHAFEQFGSLWRPKFPITRESIIVAAGSCFAQHVGRWLRENDFAFQPSELDDRHDFSFATGNIYTPALLRQWLSAAVAETELAGGYQEVQGKFVDLLRPSICTHGYDSLEKLMASREAALQETLNSLEAADVFIFTLGLTEAWIDAEENLVFPMCPGTMNGIFLPDRHRFKNFTLEESQAELDEAIKVARSVNKEIRFLLTVSPVPLTATASDDHVLTATVYSKSVLRVCAGRLEKEHADVDYFPSYELITGNPNQKAIFEPNMRTVSRAAVSSVMAHLEAGLLANEGNENSCGTSERLVAVSERGHDNEDNNAKASEEAICDEIYLDQGHSVSTLAPHFLLVGDSQMGMLAASLKERGIPYLGGMQFNGSNWAIGQFLPDNEEFLVPLESKQVRSDWSKTVDRLDAFIAAGAKKPTVITNVGMHIRASVNQMMDHVQSTAAGSQFDVNQGLSFVKEHRMKHIEVLLNFVKRGYEVLVLSDPPLQRHYTNGATAEAWAQVYEQIFFLCVNDIGARGLNVREWLTGKNGIDERYISEVRLEDGSRDWMHGSVAYYKEVSEKILEYYPYDVAVAAE